MALLQLARGLWTKFAKTENPFEAINGMEENLRLIDDHLGLYTVLPPQPPGTPFPANPANGDGQIYTDGTYAVFNGGSWNKYNPRLGLRVVQINTTEGWTYTPTGWQQHTEVDTAPVVAAAQAAVAQAEAARDAAVIGAGLYPDEPTGRAAVADGAYFCAIGTGDIAVTIYRRTSAAASVPVTALSSTQILQILSRTVVPGFALAFTDAALNVAGGFTDDGTFTAMDADIKNLLVGALKFDGAEIKAKNYPGFVFVYDDTAGNPVFGIRDDGAIVAVDLIVQNLNGEAPGGSVNRSGGAYPYEIAFVNNAGESLAEGSTGTAITVAQEYDSLCWPARAASPGQPVPMTVANGQYAARGECPMFGAAAMYKQLIRNENGLLPEKNKFQLLGCNNGWSGYKIAQILKGTPPYAAMLAQFQAVGAYGAALGVSAGIIGTDLTIGANDGNPAGLTPVADFKAQIIQLAADLTADGMAATGQPVEPIVVMGQLASRAPAHAVAQLEAAQEVANIYLACPMYHLTFYDALHINPQSERILGGYYGLVKKRVVTDKMGWEPLRPVSHIIVGGQVYLRFNKSGLAFDTALVSAQTNFGFDGLDATGAAIVQTAPPKLAGTDTVLLTFSGVPAKIRAGWQVSAGRTDEFQGGSVNLRDSQGAAIQFDGYPMHNWCVIFSYTI